MTLNRISIVFWSLLYTAVFGSAFSLVLIGNPAMNSLNLRMSDVQTCIEQFGSLSCGIQHIVGAEMVAVFAVGALVSVICALPVLIFSQRSYGPGKPGLIGFCMGAVVYSSAKLLGLIHGFLFVDLFSLCFLGTCAGVFVWFTWNRQTLATYAAPSRILR
jgi:hypothetical protein